MSYKKPCLLTEVFRKNCLVTDSITIKILAVESDLSLFSRYVTCLIYLISLSLHFLIYKSGALEILRAIGIKLLKEFKALSTASWHILSAQ